MKKDLHRSTNLAAKLKVKGFVIYEGPSVIDHEPIIAVLVPSENEKTEGGWQLWIMRSDVHPMDAIRNGQDESVCGSCPLRRTLVQATPANGLKEDTFSRGCYVIPPPIGKIFKQYHAGVYSRDLSLLDSIAEGEFLRFGAYGDPAAVPVQTLQNLRQRPWKKTAGYTHQKSRETFDKAVLALVMVSCDSLQDRAEAKAMGARTFRVDWRGEGLQPGEIYCPATPEGGSKTSCRRCGLCNGTESGAKDIVVKQHGGSATKHKKLVMDLIVH